MKSSLNSDEVNFVVSREAIISALLTVEFNFRVDKCNNYCQTYYCAGVIKVSSIRNSKCDLLFFDENTGKVFVDRKNFDLSCFPPELLKNATRSGNKFMHVLVKKRMFYNSMAENIETAILVPIGRPQIGARSNSPTINEVGKRVLLNYYKNQPHFDKIPLPRYSTLRKLGELFQKKLNGLKKIISFEILHSDAA